MMGEWCVLPGGAKVRIQAQTGLGQLDFYAAAGQTIALRTPVSGERVRPYKLGGHSKKLKEWLIDRKIPQRWRSRLPILAVDGVAVAIWDGLDWQRFWSEGTPNHSLTLV
jgi:tRNA(Ile)-lysidine synthetase-like protein